MLCRKELTHELTHEPRRNSKILSLELPASPWLPWLFLAVAVVSAALAFYNVRVSRKTARQRATLDFINAYNNETRVDEAFAFLRGLPANGDIPPDFDESAERRNFLFLMNQFEMLAIGLKRKIYDKQMALDAFGYDLRHIHALSQSLIRYMQRQNPEAFLEFEALAKKVIARHK